MKRLIRIFVLSKSEQRAVMLVVLALMAGAFAGYERRVHQSSLHQPAAAAKTPVSPSPSRPEDEQ
jgi:hypothetical protein